MSPDIVLDPETCETAGTLPVNPFVASRYHFGMLLGVDDFETEQGYHRGKVWLHSSWLHGAGVVWGLRVELRADHRELAVLPGLAVDGAGRELYIDREHCVDVAKWLAEEAPDDLDVTEHADGTRSFTGHVVVTARHCLDRPVPAISEPCEPGDMDVAHSRTVELARIELVAGPAPEPGDGPYTRLRMLFGLLPAADQEVADARDEIDALPEEDRPAALLRWFRAFAAEDVMELLPAGGVAGGEAFAAEPGTSVVLAEVEIRLADFDPDDLDAAEVVTDNDASTVDNRVRPSHVATRTIQELLCGPTVDWP